MLQLIAAILSLLLLAGAFGRGMDANEKASAKLTENVHNGRCASGAENPL